MLGGDEKGDIIIPHSDNNSNSLRKSKIVSEAGLYSLVLCSRKPEAKPFKRWVTHDVLPSLRKTGRYMLATKGVISNDTLGTLCSK